MAVYGWQQDGPAKGRLDAKFSDTVLFSMNSTGISFHNSAPVAQASAIGDPASTTGGNNTAIDSILVVLRNLGLIAT